MNRRENLKLLFTGSIGTGLLLTNCTPDAQKIPPPPPLPTGTIGGRTEEEILRDQRLMAEKFFTEEEKKKLTLLVDIIMPADDISPAASEIGTVDFIDFMMIDQPYNQTPMRGGLMWLDYEADEKFGKPFLELEEAQIMEIVDEAAWPESAKPGYEGAVKWFNLVRNFAATGFFSSEAGWKYMDYKGNQANVWDGVPQEVMEKHGVALPEKYIPLYLKPEERAKVAEWDEEGNLIG